MAVVELILDIKDSAYLIANPTKVLANGEPIFLNDGRYAFGDGSTLLSGLTFFSTQGGYIPLTGTAVGSPITGNLQFLPSQKINAFVGASESLVELGGTSVYISSNNGTTYSQMLLDVANGIQSYSSGPITNEVDGGGRFVGLKLLSSKFFLYCENSSGGTGVSITGYKTPVAISGNGTNNSLVITDAISSKGAVYLSDYSANFTSRSLIDKGYADNTYLLASSSGSYVTTNTNYTLILTDANKTIQVNTFVDSTITVPNNADISYNIGAIISIQRSGIGRVDVIESDGVYVKSTDRKLSIKGENGVVFLKKIKINEWEFYGDTDYVWDIDFKNWYKRLPEKISKECIDLFNNFFTGIKAYNGVDSISDIFDYLYFFGAPNAQIISQSISNLNAINTSFPIVQSSTPPTWSNTGYVGGAGKFLKNGFIDSVSAKALTLTDAMMFIYVNTEGGGSEIEMGNWVDDTSATASFVGAKYGSNAIGALNKINGAAYDNGIAVASAIGLTATERVGNNTTIWKNGILLTESVVVPDSLVTTENHFLAILYGNYGSVIRNSTKEVYAAGKGSSYNLDQLDFNNRFKSFKNGIIISQKQPFGTIFYDKFARTSIGADYTNTSGAFTANGTNLVAANTSGGQWDKALIFTKASYKCGFERTNQVVKTTVDSVSSKGIAIGYIGMYNSLEVGFRFDTGRIVFTKSAGTTTLFTSTGTLAVSNGDDLKITIKDHKGVFTCKVLNIATGVTLKSQYEFKITYSQTIIRPSHYALALYACGGTQNITYWKFETPAETNADFALIGDSNFFRFYQGYKSTSIGEQLGVGKNWFTYGGPGLKTSDINWNDVVAANPKQAIINLGTNDTYGLVPIATCMANLQVGVTLLEAAGIKVTICKIPHLNIVDVRPYNVALVTNFGARVGPDLFSIFPSSVGIPYQWLDGTYTDDYIHFNQKAVPIVVSEIKNYLI